MAGAFRPKQQVTVRALAEALGVSPMPVRESLAQLAAQGIFEVLPSGRAMVRGMSRSEFAELLDLRLLLEGRATYCAVSAATAETIRALRAIHQKAEAARAATQIGAVLEANRAFRFTLYEAGAQPMLVSLIELLYLRAGPFINRAVTLFFGSSRDFHAGVIEAVVSGDAAAAAELIQQDSSHYGLLLLQHYAFDSIDGNEELRLRRLDLSASTGTKEPSARRREGPNG